jgi:hypothetical protein
LQIIKQSYIEKILVADFSHHKQNKMELIKNHPPLKRISMASIDLFFRKKLYIKFRLTLNARFIQYAIENKSVSLSSAIPFIFRFLNTSIDKNSIEESVIILIRIKYMKPTLLHGLWHKYKIDKRSL